MRKAQYLWITALPMLFVGIITLTGAYEMFWMFATKASSIADGGQAFALYLDAGLVAVVALLAIIVLGDSMMQWFGYVVLKRPFTSSEVVVMAGGSSPGRLQTTIHYDEEKRLQFPGGGCC
jgi:carbon starvation protein